jgi:hypothetical protein
VTNLRILDTYLNEANSEQLLKDAILMAKPFFFRNILQDKIAAATRTLMDAFKAESTSNLLLEYYLFNAWYPEARHSHVVQKISNFSEQGERLKITEAILPEHSRAHVLKKWVSLMGQESPAATKEELASQAQDEYGALAQMRDKSDKIEQEILDGVAEERKRVLQTNFDQDNHDREEVKRRSGLNIYAYDSNELNEIFQYIDKMEDLSTYIEINQQDIQNSFSQGDWLHLYGSSIKEHNIDMNELLRYTITKNRKTPDEYLSELQSLFPGTSQSSLSWDHLADYSLFLSQVYEQGYLANEQSDNNYDLMRDYLVKQLDIIDGEDLIRSQSVYEKIKHQKHKIDKVATFSSSIREELRDFAKLERRVMKQRVARENIEVLIKSAPRDIQDLAQRVLSSQSHYLNFSEFEHLLQAKDYARLRSSEGLASVIDKDRLFQDLRKGGNKQLQNLMNNYMKTPLDVVSIAEARATVAHAPTSATFDERMQAQFRTLLDFVED